MSIGDGCGKRMMYVENVLLFVVVYIHKNKRGDGTNEEILRIYSGDLVFVALSFFLAHRSEHGI